MTSPSRGTASPFLAAALAYAARGWRVFPLVPGEKRPITENGFQDATSTRSDVLRWWQSFPQANIGLATGDPFDVLDIDGTNAVPALQDILGATYRHDGPVASTGKGKHLYFRALEGGRNRAGLLGGKLDYRGSGGYVVAPPSLHPSGRTYGWADHRDESRALPLVPEALRAIVLGSTAKPRATVAIRDGGLTFDAERLDLLAKGDLMARRPPILDVCDELGLQVQRSGAHWVTHCLFHAERTPSMVLYTKQDKFYCYGCEAKGDSHDLRDRRDMTGREAI